jgi:5-methylthioadenosine/S-adenosylhomocysteine deaminase
MGKQADVVRFTGLSPTLAYIHDPYQQLVYCAAASAVSDVWVAGVHVVAEGEVTTVDIGTVVADAREAARGLVQLADLNGLSVLR